MSQEIKPEEIRDVYLKADLLFDESEVQSAIQRMAFDISMDLSEENPIIVPVMNGGLVVGGQLLTRLNFPLQQDYIHATRYRNTTSGHELEWKTYPNLNFKGRTVLVVDDIYDEGHTLAAVVEYLRNGGAKKILVAVLLDKQHDRKPHNNLKADYVGLEIEDRYVFGFGLDYKGYWRNAPGIFAVSSKS